LKWSYSMKYTLATLLALCLTGATHAQTLNISELFGFPCTPPLSSFCVDGAQPVALIQASDGNFYGVNQTSFAAHGTTVHPAGGTVFKITAGGQVTVLYTFQRNTTTGFFDQGSNPAALAEGTDGFLYGVAGTGGPTSASAGTVFKVSKSGTGFQVLQTFCTSCTTGGFPNNIIPGTDGNLYGTTTALGFFPSNGSCEGLGCGVFRPTPPGTYTVLHALNGTTDDSVPLGVSTLAGSVQSVLVAHAAFGEEIRSGTAAASFRWKPVDHVQRGWVLELRSGAGDQRNRQHCS
jgi:hypothetical protein